LLMLAGPTAAQVLAAAGLGAASQLEPLQHRVLSWRGLIVTVSRWRGLGYEIGCMAHDAPAVFERLVRAGADYGLMPAGDDAGDILALEHGIVSPWRDFAPARDAFAAVPFPALAGLAEPGAARVLAAFEARSVEPFARSAIYRGTVGDTNTYTAEFRSRVDARVGEVVRSLYSPALRRVIGYAVLDSASAAPGSQLVLRRLTLDGIEDIAARVVTLPFLPAL
jgi:aminomethyltransferase